MADESIRIDLDIQDAIKDADALNAKLTSIEDRSARMGTAAELGVRRVVLTTSQTTQSAINRTVDAFSSKVASLSGDAVSRANADYQAAIRRVAGDVKAVDSVTQKYKEQLAVIQKIRSEERASVLQQAAYRAASPVERIALDRASSLKSLGAGASKAEITALNAEFDKLAVNAGNSAKTVQARIAEFITSPTYAARKSVSDLASGWGVAGIGIAAAAAVAAIGVYKLYENLKASAAAAQETVNLAARLGTSTEQAYRLEAGIRTVGGSADSVAGFVRKLSQAVADGGEEGKKGAEALRSIGVYALDASGHARPLLDIMKELGAAIKQLPAGAEQEAALAKIGGRGVQGLLPYLLSLQEINASLDKHGNLLQEKLIDKLAKANPDIQEMGLYWDLVQAKIAGATVELIHYFTESERHPQGFATVGGGSLQAQRIRRQNEFTGLGALEAQSRAGAQNAFAASFVPPSADEIAANALQERAKSFLANGSGGVTALEEAIKAKQSELAKAESDLANARYTGVGDTATEQKQEGAVTRLRNEFEQMKKNLQLINEVTGVEKTAHDSQLKSIRELDVARAKSASVLAGYSAAEITSAEATAKAVGDYQERISALKDQGLLNSHRIVGPEAGVQFTGLAVPAGTDTFKQYINDLQKAQLGTSDDRINQIREEGKNELGYQTELFEKRQSYAAETLTLNRRTIDDGFAYESRAAEFSRDSQLRAVEVLNAKTLQEKVNYELAKGQIEANYQSAALSIAKENVNRQADREIAATKSAAKYDQAIKAGLSDRIASIDADRIEKTRQLQIAATAETAKAQGDAAIKVAETIRDANQRLFDDIKGQASGLLDVIFKSNNRNIGANLANFFKERLLSGIEDVLSTQIAKTGVEQITGNKVGLDAGPLGAIAGGGVLGTILGHVNQRPTFEDAVQKSLQRSKLEQGGHLGDLVLSGGAVPVTIIGGDVGGAGAVVHAQTTAVSQNFAISGGSGGFGSAGLPGLLGRAGANGANGAPGGILGLVLAASQSGLASLPSSSASGRPFVSSSISYGGASAGGSGFSGGFGGSNGAGGNGFGGGGGSFLGGPGAGLSLPYQFLQSATTLQQALSGSGGGGGFSSVGGGSAPAGIVTSTFNGLSTGPGAIFGGGTGDLTPGQAALLQNAFASGGYSPSRPGGFGGETSALPSPFYAAGGDPAAANAAGGGYTGGGATASIGGGGNINYGTFGGGTQQAQHANLLSGIFGSIAKGGKASGIGGLFGLTSTFGLPNTQASTIYGLPGGAQGTPAAISAQLGGGVLGTLAGGAAAFVSSPLAATIGTGLVLGSFKNPYKPSAAIASTGGGALLGANLGSKVPGVGLINGAIIGAGGGLLANGVANSGTLRGFGEIAVGSTVAGAGIGNAILPGGVGALIGAGVGAAAGLVAGAVSLFLPGRNIQIKNQIKAAYGITINDQSFLSQINQISNQSYGGNIAATIRSEQVRQMLELYGQATGQNVLGVVGHAQASIFANQNGKLNELPTYFNGAPVLPGGTQTNQGIPILTPHGGYAFLPVYGGANTLNANTPISGVPLGPNSPTSPGGASLAVNLQLDEKATERVLTGQAAQAISDNPRMISSAAAVGASTSAGRRNLVTGLLDSNFLTA